MAIAARFIVVDEESYMATVDAIRLLLSVADSASEHEEISGYAVAETLRGLARELSDGLEDGA